jgi:ABC-type proline/glycine betaine transport system ATPase subunit
MKPNAAIIGASEESLFLRMIADLDPNEGKVFLGDLPRASMPATRWRRNVVYVAAQSRARIPEFESSQPSQAVQSPRCDLRVCENS